MKDNNIKIILPNLPKNHLHNLTKERYLYMSKKQYILWIKSSILKEKKQKACDFYKTTNHTTNKCTTSRNIGLIIDGNFLAEFIQDTCPFKVIESDLYVNTFCISFAFTKVQHLKYHQLLSKTIPCINQIPNIDNLLVKVTWYAKYGLPISWFANAIFQFPLIISYIHNKKNSKTIKLFSTLSIECVGEFFFLKKNR